MPLSCSPSPQLPRNPPRKNHQTSVFHWLESTDSKRAFQHLLVRNQLAISKSMHRADAKSCHKGQLKSLALDQLGSESIVAAGHHNDFPGDLQKYAKIHHLGVIIPKYGWKMTSK